MDVLPLVQVHTPVQHLEKALVDFVQHKHLVQKLEYGFAQVQWRQLSIIFCTTSNFPPNTDSLLFFGSHQETFIKADFPLREHLLFVTYVNATETLYFLGDLSFNAYQEFLDLGFISVGDLRREDSLLYNEYAPEEQFIGHARQFSNFYIPHFANPDQAYRDIPVNKQIKVLQGMFDDVVHGIPRKKPRLKEKEGKKDPLFYEIIMDRLLCQKHRPLAFYCACLLSALQTNFYTEYIKHEQARLYILLELLFFTEAKRVFFVQQWLSPLVQVCAPRCESQFYNRPSGFDITAPNSDLKALQARHALRYPNRPYPGLYFTAPLIDAPNLIGEPDLPVHNGIVSFTHYELMAFLNPMVERAIQTQVDFFQKQDNNYHMLTRYVAPFLSRYQLGQTPLHVMEDQLRKANPKLNEENEIQPILNVVRSKLPDWLNRVPSLLDAALRLIVGLDNSFNIQDRYVAWSRSRATADLSGQFYDRNPELKELHQEIPPATYQDLLEYAKRCWPPCMQKLAADRVGENHMRHEQRIAMSAQLRRFGYSEKQGTDYWHLLFQETDLYQQSGEHNFLESQQGLVIVYDYKRDKQQNIGVSCRNWMGKKLCPFVEIEDIGSCDCKQKNGPQFQCDCKETACQSICKTNFAMQNPGHALAYGVKSPRDYFFQARASLGPALYKRE
jgi:hypothetical protein